MDLLYRALDVLEFVCVSGSASADEVAESLDVPRSSRHYHDLPIRSPAPLHVVIFYC